MEKSYTNTIELYSLKSYIKASKVSKPYVDLVAIGTDKDHNQLITIGKSKIAFNIYHTNNDNLLISFKDKSIAVIEDGEIIASGVIDLEVLEELKGVIARSDNYIGSYIPQGVASNEQLKNQIIASATKPGFVTSSSKIKFDGETIFIRSNLLNKDIIINDPKISTDIYQVVKVDKPSIGDKYIHNGSDITLTSRQEEITFKVESKKEFDKMVSSYNPSFKDGDYELNIKFNMELEKEKE